VSDDNVILFPITPRLEAPKPLKAVPVKTLPPKVALKDGRYYYRDKGKWHPLTRAEEGAPALYNALQKYTFDRPATYGQLMVLYVARQLPELKPATQTSVLHHINGRLQHHFGHMILNSIESTHVAQYLQLRKTEGAPICGNREFSALSSVISWGMRFGWCAVNPCYGVRRNRETPSRVYVTDEYFRSVIDLAPPCLQHLFAVAYLTGLRQGDLLNMTRANITERGIELRQRKDGKHRVITWSPTLKLFVERALERSACEHVFVSANGRPYSPFGLQCAMKRLKAKNGGQLFKFRELRPKAASDADHNVLGHDAGMLVRYVRAQTLKPVR